MVGISAGHISDQELAAHAVGARRAEEAAATAIVLSRMPTAQDRAEMQHTLLDPHTRVVAYPDSVVAAQISAIYHIRALDALVSRRDAFKGAARWSGATVTLAVSSDPQFAHGIATIIRAANSYKQATIVIPPNTTPEALASTIGDLQGLRNQFGDAPLAAQRVTVNGIAAGLRISDATRLRYTTYLAAAGSAPPSNLPGVGIVHSIQVKVSPVAGNQTR